MTHRLLILSAVLIALSAWTHARTRAADISRFDFAAALPFAFDEWVGRDAPPLDPRVAKALAADQYVHRYYGSRTTKPRTTEHGLRIADVEVDLAYYARPQAGAAMHSPLNCLPGNGWQVVQARTVPVADGGGTIAVRQLVVARGSERVAMTYWFQSRGAIVGNEYRQRLQLLSNGLQGRPTDAALVRVMAPDTRDGDSAINRFSRKLAPILSAAFR